MSNKELAAFLFPNANDISYYVEKYSKRNLDDSQMVVRFAPSPTGFVHMGSLSTSFLTSLMAKQSNGVFILRIEDTDQKREVENGIEGIINDLLDFNIIPDEGPTSGGEYGSYIQSERKDIYAAFAKYMIENDVAYPCFCGEEESDEIRKLQEATKERIGYYGNYATCRKLSCEEIKELVESGREFAIRLKSQGNFDTQHTFHDEIKGNVEYNENDIDHIMLKSDKLPTYHFAHVVDDYLMQTTHVTRGEEWLPSLPLHLEIFKLLELKAPKYAHFAPISKPDEETGNIRKLSKRKDPEASVRYYHQLGIPANAVKIFLLTIGNSNFEEWFLENSDKDFLEFPLTFEKMPTTGPVFDLTKLENVSKNYLSTLTAKQVYEEALKYYQEYDINFYNILAKYKDYSVEVFNIEREVERPRKDIAGYSDIKKEFWFMYDELFFNCDPYKEIVKEYVKSDLIDYLDKVYSAEDNSEDWFNKVKEYATQVGYASNKKDYKENPDNYKGLVADFCEVIRVMATSKTVAPNLYDVLKLIGKERLIKRLELFLK